MFEDITVGLYICRDSTCNRGALLSGLKSLSLERGRGRTLETKVAAKEGRERK